MRYITENILKDSKEKMIILSGARQCGKTTLSQDLMGKEGIYLNWDIKKDQKVIREIGWPKTASFIILDELHKYPKWKNYLKGIADEFKNKPPILVTGSARLETFSKQGDSLTGRFYHYRLHPIDILEAKAFLPQSNPSEHLNRLLETGGFPEAFLNPENAERLRNNCFDLVLQEDLRDLTKSNSIRGIQLLLELLRERVGQLINFSNLAKDLSVSSVTVKVWIELLVRLYLVFIVMPYSKGFNRSIRKDYKIYFYDCASAYDSAQKLENAVASTILKICNWKQDVTGVNWGLYFFRDREKREVDFIVTKGKSIVSAFEVKSSDDSLSANLRYFQERAQVSESIQLVKNIDRPKEISNIKILDLASGISDWAERILADS